MRRISPPEFVQRRKSKRFRSAKRCKEPWRKPGGDNPHWSEMSRFETDMPPDEQGVVIATPYAKGGYDAKEGVYVADVEKNKHDDATVFLRAEYPDMLRIRK